MRSRIPFNKKIIYMSANHKSRDIEPAKTFVGYVDIVHFIQCLLRNIIILFALAIFIMVIFVI